jgi:5'-nucleotidase
MSAAIEAGIEGIPAIGFSLLDYAWSANFEACENYVKTIVEKALKEGLPNGMVLNVNIPNLTEKQIKGIKVCRQAKANWVEEFDKRKNPQDKDYYWLSGKFVNLDGGEDTDEWALENGYVSVVPIQFDLTAHHFIQNLNSWKLND